MTRKMSPPVAAPLYEIVLEVRLLFHRLASTGDEIHADLGITVAQRGVLESLTRAAPKTVPQIAREKGVSRQHIQTLVNELAERELVRGRENPAHQRSPLLELTDAGWQCFAEVSRRESLLLGVMSRKFEKRDLEVTAGTLREFRQQLEKRQEAT